MKFLNTQLTAIVITLILVSSLLYVSGAFVKPSFATINHEKGYTVLGYLYAERVTDEVKTYNDKGEYVRTQSIDEALEEFGKYTSLKEGWTLEVQTAIEYTASRSNFTLIVDKQEWTGTKESTVLFADINQKMKQMQQNTITNRAQTSQRAITFDRPPRLNVFDSLTALLK